jgi:hypothetical protein
MAIAMPPSDMMFDVSERWNIGRNASTMAIGSVMIATSAERTCQRKIEADERDDDALLDELLAQRVRWSVSDQLAAIVRGARVRTPFGQRWFAFPPASCLMPSITRRAFSP